MNVRPVIAAVMSSDMATLHELQTVYSVLDAYNMLEVVNVNNHNARVSRSKVK